MKDTPFKPPFVEDIPLYKILEALENRRQFIEKELVFQTKIPRETYRSWRNGTCEPSRRRFWRELSTYFQIPVDLLIWGPKTKEDLLKLGLVDSLTSKSVSHLIYGGKG